MYERFFQLQQFPFAMVPDPESVHLTGQHADVISGAVYGILERKGCLLLTGEAGLGKTTAVRAVINLLSESNAHSSLIIHPTLDAAEFLELVLLNFGISPVPGSKAQRLRALEAFLLEAATAERVCVLIVDEAHKLHPDALEEIRLLGNLEYNGHKLLQILLAGQNELVDRLNLPELWQLKQRIALRLKLARLDRDGVEQYVRFRWKRAGGLDLPFDDAAIDGIAKWSLGIPRVINALCDHALMLAFAETSREIGLPIVAQACQELDLQMGALGRGPEPLVPRALAADRGPAPAPKLRQTTAPIAKTKAAPRTGPTVVPGATSTWGAERPSLFKRWLRFAADQERDALPSPDEDPLSLKRYL